MNLKDIKIIALTHENLLMYITDPEQLRGLMCKKVWMSQEITPEEYNLIVKPALFDLAGVGNGVE